MGTPPLVRALDLLTIEARQTVLSDPGLRALFDLLDRQVQGSPKEATAAAIAGRTLWEFRRAMKCLTACSWRDFLRIRHLRERTAQGTNLLKKARAVASDAGFSSLKAMRSAETWALRAHARLDGPLAPSPRQPKFGHHSPISGVNRQQMDSVPSHRTARGP
jgi:hypothetical protein